MTPRDPKEAADDARKSYDLAIAEMRKKNILNRVYRYDELRNDEERQMWTEGPFDTVRK